MQEWDYATDGLKAIGFAVNAGLIWFIVQWVKARAPQLREKAPQYIPLLAIALGPALELLGNGLSGLLLVPIDLGPIAEAFGEIASGFSPLAGAMTVAVDQFGRQRKRGG